MRGTLVLRHRLGYAMVDSNGSTYMFGGIDPYPGVNTPDVVDLELIRAGDGGWIATRAGVVYTIGDAHAFNDPDTHLARLGEGRTRDQPFAHTNRRRLLALHITRSRTALRCGRVLRRPERNARSKAASSDRPPPQPATATTWSDPTAASSHSATPPSAAPWATRA